MARFIKFEPRQSVSLAGVQCNSSKQAPFRLRLVSTKAERRAVFELRMRAYRHLFDGQSIADDTQYKDAFDDEPTTVLMGAYDEDRLVGAMRLCFSPPGHALDTLPCAAYYPALVGVKRNARSSLMEVSRFSIDPDINNTSYRTTLYASLVRASLMAAKAANVSMILIATRPDWVRFYKYMLGFELIGEPAFYPPGNMKIALLGGTLAQAETRQSLQNRFFNISNDEIASMRDRLAPVLTCVEAA